MATETRWASAHATGSVTTPSAAVGATDGAWTGDTGNTNWTSRWNLDDPSGSLSGTQTIRVLARKESSGGNDPTAVVSLYENGSLVSELVASTALTSAAGQTLEGTFDASAISDPAAVEVEVATIGAGGPPASRRAAQIDSIEWVVNLGLPTVSGGSETTITVAEDGGGAKTGQGGADGVVAVATDAGGSKSVSSGSEAVIAVSATGGGMVAGTEVTGGSETVLNVDVDGGGIKVAAAGSEGTVEASATADGIKQASGGAVATLDISASGGGSNASQPGNSGYRVMGKLKVADDGILQSAVGAVSDPVSAGGWSATGDGDAYINDLGASAVPAGAHFLGGFAHDEDGVRYVTSDAPSGAFCHGGIAVRADGAMHVSTEAAQRRLSGVGVRDDGSVCVSAII